MTPAGIERATFRFVAQHLVHCATAVPVSPSCKSVMPSLLMTGVQICLRTPRVCPADRNEDHDCSNLQPGVAAVRVSRENTGRWMEAARSVLLTNELSHEGVQLTGQCEVSTVHRDVGVSYCEDSYWPRPANTWEQTFGNELLALNGLATRRCSEPKCLSFATDTAWLWEARCSSQCQQFALSNPANANKESGGTAAPSSDIGTEWEWSDSRFGRYTLKKKHMYRLNISVEGSRSWSGSFRLDGKHLHHIFTTAGMRNLLVSKLSAVPACPSGKDTWRLKLNTRVNLNYV